MHVLLAHERFLFRFGVDRVLMLYGIGLKKLGWKISILANRVDRDVLETFADKIVLAPESHEFKNNNEFALKWLQTHWEAHFGDERERPDVVVVGGWPFLKCIPLWKEHGIRVVFSDHGVVPLTGYQGYQLEILQKLKTLRQQNMPHCDAVIAVSDFILESQSRADAGDRVECIRIYNGADHMHLDLWRDGAVGGVNESRTSVARIRQLKEQSRKFILNLGRWEDNNYKNSSALYEIIPEIIKHAPNGIVGILGTAEQINIPSTLQGHLVPLGFPSDEELQELMREADMGLSVSLWEGFNLGLGEMQWMGKPVLVFRKGAHPEVVMHPWFLCEGSHEMATKAVEVLRGGGIGEAGMAAAVESFKKRFSWQRTVALVHDELLRICAKNQNKAPRFQAIIDVSNAVRDPANSGVMRVTRRVAREIQARVKSFFVIWDEQLDEYRFPNQDEYQQLGAYNGPLREDFAPVSTAGDIKVLRDFLKELERTPTWLFFLETIMERVGRKARAFAKAHHLKTAAVFYDAIALLRPELVADEIIRTNHTHYMRGLAETDLIFPISHFSAACLLDFFEHEQLPFKRVVPNQLPGELAGRPRNHLIDARLLEPVQILCVSTLEPRKNHIKIIEACERLSAIAPNLNWRLTLIGNKYAGAFDLADRVQAACDRDPRIEWLGVVDDETLHAKYAECAFTIYASEIEGFGLPICESLWHGRPCICHEQGVMAEIAAAGGCLTVDVTDADRLAEAIARLAQDQDLYARLAEQAVGRRIKSWDEYIEQMIFVIERDREIPATCIQSLETFVLDKSLYPGCITENWQMSHSERLALMALLHRYNPEVCIEVGTFRGGSLSLIAQYAKKVFSIDIDPTIPERYAHLSNVHFLTGRSSELLPSLLKELNESGLGVDLVLIDGDHSKDGVMGDLNILLAYQPIRPLSVLMHDSFNPECRAGMLQANWHGSKYLHFADLDFVPGRLIEHGGGGHGEMWGGLSLLMFLPQPRKGPPTIQRSANMMHEAIKSTLADRPAISCEEKVESANPEICFEEISEPLPIAISRIQKQRILICSSFYPPYFIGGAELIAHYQAREFTRQGHEVEVFAGTVEPMGPRYSLHTETYDGVKVHRVVLTAGDFDATRENFHKKEVEELFQKILQEFQPNVVHCHNLIGLTTGLLRLAKKSGCIVALTVHDHWGFCHKNIMGKEPGEICEDIFSCQDCMSEIALENGLKLPTSLRQSYLYYQLDAVDAFISPSRYLASTYLRAGFPAARMQVVWYGIDTDKFGAIVKKPDPDRCRFTFIGHFGRHKGLYVLLKALLHISEQNKFRVNLVGDGEERRNVEDFISKHGLHDCTQLRGKIDNTQIADIMAETDVLVLPSIWPENQPVSITEAMASSIPVIASDAGGIPELIVDGQSGFLFELGNSVQLAEKMVYFINNPDAIQQFGESARQRIAERSFSNQILRLLNVYDGCQDDAFEGGSEAPLIVLDLHEEEEMDRVAKTFFQRNYPRFDSPRFIYGQWLSEEQLAKARFVLFTCAASPADRARRYLQSRLPILVPGSSQQLVNMCYEGNCGLHYASIDELEVCIQLLLDNPEICRQLGANGSVFAGSLQ